MELKLDFNEKKLYFNNFLNALEKCPHAIKPDIGGEEFAKELIKGAEIIATFFEPSSN
jgi:hypothetical protein